MDPSNPRWMDAEERRRRSATFWKIIVGAAGAAALSTVIVASCLDRGEERRDRDRAKVEEPGITETTAASMTSPTPTAYEPGTDPAAAQAAPPVVGPSTSDSTGGVAATATATTSTADRATAPPAATTIATGTTTVTSAEAQRSAQPYTPGQAPFESAYGPNGVNGVALSPSAAPANTSPTAGGTTAGAGADGGAGSVGGNGGNGNGGAVQNGGGDAGVIRDARGNVIDPNNRGSNPQSPPMSAGAGRFNTEAPYWSSSAFESNPEAGAGPFTTERNTPGY